MRKIKYKKGRKVQSTVLEYTGIHKDKATEMQLFVYDDADLTEYREFGINEFTKCVNLQKVNWLNVHGLNDLEILKSLGSFLEIDNFILGDILNTTSRTKLDELHDVLFFNIKSLLPFGRTNQFFGKRWDFGFLSRKKKRFFLAHSGTHSNAFGNC